MTTLSVDPALGLGDMSDHLLVSMALGSRGGAVPAGITNQFFFRPKSKTAASSAFVTNSKQR